MHVLTWLCCLHPLLLSCLFSLLLAFVKMSAPLSVAKAPLPFPLLLLPPSSPRRAFGLALLTGSARWTVT
jgi:hypothetical protein